jgi:hypothetical protein
MSENVFDIQRRIGEVFKIHGQPTPQPQFDEGATEYRQRLLCVAKHLLPREHVWAGVDIRRQPERAFDSIERALVGDQIAAFKAPVGKLREFSEVCPRTGRVTTRFFGDPEDCWGVFAGPTVRRAQFTPGVGRGSDSPQYKAAVAAFEHEQGLAFQALAEQRAAAGLR